MNILIMESSDALHALSAFRNSFYYQCLNRRVDALFELTDALLTADPVPSPAHLKASNQRTAAAGEAFTLRWFEGGSTLKL
jgi:hypothetical protein